MKVDKVLGRTFFNRDTKIVARDLLGKFLVRETGKKKIVLMITETEVYDGYQDRASHAWKGKTKRTEIMFGQPGIFYVYLCYGMYFMLNIVTREYGYPAAVLIRGAKLNSVSVKLDGPGKITKFLKITKDFNNKKSAIATGLWIEDGGVKINSVNIKKTSRVGVNYAGPVWSAKKLRFVLDD